MPQNTTPTFTKEARTSYLKLTSGGVTGAAVATVFTAGEFGSRVNAISVSSKEAVANTLYLYTGVGADNAPLHWVAVPAQAGQGTINPAEALNDVPMGYIQHDAHDNRFLMLPPLATLRIKMASAVTEEVEVTVLAADF